MLSTLTMPLVAHAGPGEALVAALFLVLTGISLAISAIATHPFRRRFLVSREESRTALPWGITILEAILLLVIPLAIPMGVPGLQPVFFPRLTGYPAQPEVASFLMPIILLYPLDLAYHLIAGALLKSNPARSPMPRFLARSLLVSGTTFLVAILFIPAWGLLCPFL